MFHWDNLYIHKLEQYFFAGTVRRFLDNHGSSLDTVIFVVDKIDLSIYEVLLPLHFPRSKQEEESAR